MAPKTSSSRKGATKKAVSKEASGRSSKPEKVSTSQQARPSADDVLARLEGLATPKIRDDMAKRYGIRTADRTLGIAVGTLQKIAKELGKNHDLALALWKTRCYEARMLAAMVDEPSEVTPAQMDAWCGDFDNWGLCDTVCFKLFDQSPHAFAKVRKWCKRKEEFVRRGGFALLACVALHQKDAPEEEFASCLPLIEAASEDDRNFVKKSVNWALRALGYVRSQSIRQAALAMAKQLAASSDSTARWIGKDALKTLSKATSKPTSVK